MKVVVITGGSKGIGKATAIRFSELGYRVIICSRTKQDIDELSTQIGCGSFFCDVRYPDHVKRMFDSIKEQEGRIDVLVNCAGILGPLGHLEKNSISEWKDTIDTNLIGTVNCIQEVIPIMKKQKSGSIVNFCGGGIGGDKLPLGFTAYNTSKFAVGGFTEAISKELAFYNIKVNAVSPGAIDTDMAKSRWVKGSSPDKVVDLIVFLATTENNNINGKIISANWDKYKEENYDDESLFTLRRVVH